MRAPSACGSSRGSWPPRRRACSGLDPPLPVACRWWSGRSATLHCAPVLLLQGGQEAAKLTHPGTFHRVVSILPQIHRFPARKQGRRARFRPASPIHPPQVRPLATISGKNAFLWRNISAFARKFRAFLLTWCCSRGVCRWEARWLDSAGFYCGWNFRSELVRVHADRFDGDGRRLCWDQECLGTWEVRATGWH